MLLDPATWLAFCTLAGLEIVLGIDNILFISLLVARLPPERQTLGRLLGLGLAMLTRIALLFSVLWLAGMTAPWFALGAATFSGRDVILFGGGVFLVAKSVHEIRRALAGAAEPRRARPFASLPLVVLEIAVIDIVFSLDSVFTAVGLARPDQVAIMVAAIIASIIAMMLVSASISGFIERRPTLKILSLAFLVLVGVALVAEAFHQDIPRGYLYFAIGFATAVEACNLRLRRALEERRQRDRADG